MIRPNFSYTFIHMYDIFPGRALLLKIQINMQFVNILNIYAPSKREERCPSYFNLFSQLKNSTIQMNYGFWLGTLIVHFIL